ncbi:Transcription factor WhiB [Streptomyces sp. cf386]|uniref:WhiB family transcriptional regulator n=1 Tax=Streptomyces sp. cf386 TaxID=1761904 RepID=UPI0008883085|nr:WhiB family transcriptional regulator [Streptomyces sp. cf386]SDM47434.1 Transcription factor WhiB [Streptomyces sp. cf386]
MSASRQHPDTLPNGLSWADRAACRGYDLELFFSEAAANVAYVKRICKRCPVREECLAEGLRAEDGCRYGIYGGLTPAERTELAAESLRWQAKELLQAPPKPRTGRKPAKCGTRSAYQRHVKNGEPIDDACRAANTAADNRLRRTGTTKVLR